MLSCKNITLFCLFGSFFILKADDQSEIDFAQQFESNISGNFTATPSAISKPTLPQSAEVTLNSLDDSKSLSSAKNDSAENLAKNISAATASSTSDGNNGTTVVSIGANSVAVDKSSIQATMVNVSNFNGEKDPAKQEAFLQSQLNLLRNANNLLQQQNAKLSNDPQIKLVPGTVLSQENFGIVIAASGAIFIGLCALLGWKLYDLWIKSDEKINIKERITASTTKKMDEQILSLLKTYSEEELFADNPDLETIKQISRMIDNFDEMRKDPQWKGQKNDVKYAFIESFNSTTRDLLQKQIKIEEQLGLNSSRLKILKNMQFTVEKFKAPAGHSVSADFKKAMMANVSSATKQSFDDALQKRIDKRSRYTSPMNEDDDSTMGPADADYDDGEDASDNPSFLKRRNSIRDEIGNDDEPSGSLSRFQSSSSLFPGEDYGQLVRKTSSNKSFRRYKK